MEAVKIMEQKKKLKIIISRPSNLTKSKSIISPQPKRRMLDPKILRSCPSFPKTLMNQN